MIVLFLRNKTPVHRENCFLLLKYGDNSEVQGHSSDFVGGGGGVVTASHPDYQLCCHVDILAAFYLR